MSSRGGLHLLSCALSLDEAGTEDAETVIKAYKEAIQVGRQGRESVG